MILDRVETITTVDTVKHLARGPLRKHAISERLALLILDDAAEAATQMTMGEFAEAIGMSKSAVTTVIDRLIEAGLAKREHSTEDRRVTHVQITDAGRELVVAALDSKAVPA